MKHPIKPRQPLPDKGKERLCYEAGVIAWNEEADRVEIYRDGDRLKMRLMKIGGMESR